MNAERKEIILARERVEGFKEWLREQIGKYLGRAVFFMRIYNSTEY